jgi:hypothetical protein
VTDLSSMWDAAEQREAQRRADRPMSFYGKLDISGRKVVLEKGYPGGKRDFDPQMDDPDLERLSIKLTIEPVSERATRNFEREFLSNSAEADLYKQSAQTLGYKPLELLGKYVRADLVEDPRLGSYADRTTGATRQRSAAVVREVYPDLETCKEASDARYGGGPRATPANTAADWGEPRMVVAPPNAPPAAVPGPTKTSMSRDTAVHFLPGLLKTCGGDPEKFLQALAQNSLLSQHFTSESPEVQKLLGITKGDEGGDDVDLETTPF